MEIYEKLQSALKYYQDGNLQRAENIYEEILSIQPDNIDVLYSLSRIFFQNKHYDSAMDCFQKILRLNPTDACAYSNLGIILQEKGELGKALSCYQRAIEFDRNFADAYNNAGLALQKQGELDKAIHYYQKAIGCNPNFVGAHCNLGNLFRDNDQFDKAIICYQKALFLNPNLATAYDSIGICLYKKGKLNEAIAHYQKAIDIDPNYPGAYSNLGLVFQYMGQLENAIKYYSKALLLNPVFAKAYNNIGSVFEEKGQFDEAEKYYRRALQIEPDSLLFSKSFLFQMLYNPKYDAKAIFSEHLRFAKQFAEPLSSSVSHYTNLGVPKRRLRIGYVSSDFRRHAVAYFFEPVIATHKHEHFEIFCYSNSLQRDEVTKRIQEYADQWLNIAGISDQKATELIQKDEIDILVDLAGHTANNRILVFARKPSPIQISWIGYPATTGLATMDYKIVDNYTDPAGMTEQFYTEQLIRLPESFLCYLSDPDSPEVGSLPSLTTGYVSFGSFNNFTKITPEVIAVWAKILKVVHNSHLVLKATSFSDRMTRDYALSMFSECGIEGHRIKLSSWLPSIREHLNLYDHVDIALDTFPYNGTTTSCEAMWMGVPVITLAGKTHASRVGESLLSNVGLKNLIANTQDEYVDITVKLASDVKGLQTLREGLRDMMKHSPLTDAKRFTANLEKCYRKIWENWCESQI
jgi:protein O-GlcNAc transferase